jgi:hypothetical protein
MATIRKVSHSLLSFFDNLGRARAAARLSQMGYHDLARDLMLK